VSEAERTPGTVSDRVLTLPNVLSALRLVGVPVFLWLLFTHQDIWAFVVLALSGLTDYLDGKIARRFNLVSRVGQLLDPLEQQDDHRRRPVVGDVEHQLGHLPRRRAAGEVLVPEEELRKASTAYLAKAPLMCATLGRRRATDRGRMSRVAPHTCHGTPPRTAAGCQAQWDA